MPELPEVETLVRDLRESGLCGARITNVIARWPRTIAGMSPRTFRARMKGRRIAAIGRRGKYVVITLDGKTMSSVVAGTPIPVNPGKHSLIVSTQGFLSFERVVEVTSDA